jgi:hypothetical protein
VNPKSERTLLLLLAAIQFTTNLDFLIILPLGPQYMRLMHLTPAHFNLIVAAYAIAAGIAGVVAGFCLDRFDRKNALLGLFLGFHEPQFVGPAILLRPGRVAEGQHHRPGSERANHRLSSGGRSIGNVGAHLHLAGAVSTPGSDRIVHRRGVDRIEGRTRKGW